jgi:DNA-directed RNA polymerase specialized sigma24 family protein
MRQRLLAILRGLPPEERQEKFLTMLHGEGWQERARAPGAPLMLVHALHFLDIDRRLRRLEKRFGLPTV